MEKFDLVEAITTLVNNEDYTDSDKVEAIKKLLANKPEVKKKEPKPKTFIGEQITVHSIDGGNEYLIVGADKETVDSIKANGGVIVNNKYSNGKIYINGYVLSSEAYNEMVNLPESLSEIEVVFPPPFVVKYTEKSYAVLGDTRLIRDKLKDLRLKWNDNLSYDGYRTGGWIFPSSKEEQLQSVNEVIENFSRKKTVSRRK